MDLQGCSEEAGKGRITSGTREWASHNANCCLGCSNGCRYCYARNMAVHYGRATKVTWIEMKVNQKALAKPYRKTEERWMFPTSHDITSDPEVMDACFTVLKKLLESENQVLVTTKPRLSVVDKIHELFSSFQDQIQFSFTITSLNDDLLKFWEPNAPRFKERFHSLVFAFNKGYKTSVSIEPFLDYDPGALVKTVEPFCTESIWIGKMNYISRKGIREDEAPFYAAARKNYELDNLVDIWKRMKEHPKVRFKDSIRIKLSRAQ